MRASLLLVLFVISGTASPATAQSCEVALALVAQGRLADAERELSLAAPDEMTACSLYAWGRIAEARSETVRASALYRLAMQRDAEEEQVSREELVARERALPEVARQVAEAELEGQLGPVPSLAMLREVTRASMETDGWYPLGSVECRVERRARLGRLEVAVVRVTAERIARDEELRLAVREPEGWRYVSSITPLVQNGHGWRGAIELVGLDVGAETIVVRTRRWARSGDEPVDTTPSWEAAALRCARSDEDAWGCEAD